jgi:hypothetical protein
MIDRGGRSVNHQPCVITEHVGVRDYDYAESIQPRSSTASGTFRERTHQSDYLGYQSLDVPVNGYPFIAAGEGSLKSIGEVHDEESANNRAMVLAMEDVVKRVKIALTIPARLPVLRHDGLGIYRQPDLVRVALRDRADASCIWLGCLSRRANDEIRIPSVGGERVNREVRLIHDPLPLGGSAEWDTRFKQIGKQKAAQRVAVLR